MEVQLNCVGSTRLIITLQFLQILHVDTLETMLSTPYAITKQFS